jgi:hypothetical protein
VEHIVAYSPQARGRSERLFGALQDRLVKELALRGSLSPDGARYIPIAADGPTAIPAPVLPFSLIFLVESGRENVMLWFESAYEAPRNAASCRRHLVHYRDVGFMGDTTTRVSAGSARRR